MYRRRPVNLTLSIDKNLLREARKAAVEMDTTVNSLVREYLREFVRKKAEEKELFLREWEQLMDANPVNMSEKSWSREELHER
jgi:siroheme synthase (precorrin-2 oxidase/ferrochelatase)